MAKEVQLMDVTIREGSYVIDYQFTAGQVAKIAQAVDAAGICYMEVGNGGGLGAPDEYYRGIRPQSSDVEQLRAAKKVVKNCQIGLLAGPEPVTKKEHIEAVREEVDFLRIAARIDRIEEAQSNVEYARSLNIPVFFQMMRSSKRPLKDILQAAKVAESFGPSAIYLVDTIGHFLPDEVGSIIKGLKEEIKIPIGFHPHNHLMGAVSNSVAAVLAGANFVDASLGGCGRDAGNAQLEAVVAVLQRHGRLTHINLDQLIYASQKYLVPLMPQPQGVPPFEVAAAAANVCLYPMALYQQIAKAADVDFLQLVRKLGETDASEPNIEQALSEMGKDPQAILKKLGLR